MKTKSEFISWLLTGAGVESESAREFIYNTAESFFRKKYEGTICTIQQTSEFPCNCMTLHSINIINGKYYCGKCGGRMEHKMTFNNQT